MMQPATDPAFRAVTLLALCKVYFATECALLERIIAIQQRDTRAWLRQHPEHVHAFCDAFHDRRGEANQLAAEMAGIPAGDNDWLDPNGIWTILGQRYESRRDHEKRMSDAGFQVADTHALMRKFLSEEKIREMDAEIEELNRLAAEDIALGRDQDRPMRYSFWLPDREEDYGEFAVSIPKRYIGQMGRIHDYRYAGGRFPAREYTEYFAELRALNVISDRDHKNLMQWVAFESLPKAKRDALKEASAYRPITDLPSVTRFKSLVSDFDDESDELDDSDLLAITLSRREAARILTVLEKPSERDEKFQTMMEKFKRSLGSDDLESDGDG